MCIFFTCFFFALLPNYAASITFNFTNITPKNSRDILFLGGAACTTDDGIHVTHENHSDHNSSESAGRATYIRPLHLGDKNSTNLVSFSTSFTFVIHSHPNKNYTDGLTFFLAVNNSLIKGQGSLGLPFNSSSNSTIYPFVAVEFDSFGTNEWDPRDTVTNSSIGNHVGININSITSVVYQKWSNDVTYGKECRALVHYSSDSKTLGVSFTSFKDNLEVWETGLNYTIDLRDVLPEWVIFGFSASTEDWNEKHIIRSWMFSSTEVKVHDNKGSATINMLRKVGFIAGPLVPVSILAILAYFLWRMKIKNGDNEEELGLSLEMNNEFEMGASMPRRFSYSELARSTADFAETEKLGEGGFGGVYKGFLKDLSIFVAVKRVSRTSKQGIKEYASEVRIISRLRHKNLVQLTGWCHEKGELMLVYEFMENGSLDLHIFKGKSLLTWNTRYKIANGLASALLYLHEEWE
ncbi:hypothetical protein SSX86_005509 [Deinandra increscens subsp. villosa]|uniref:non-specific serine/threonine protein kinase n=1 Tax=Deinandra increscens subsp. villosa TaxID=3103831 RepID=A0AAP0H6X7_9ASTR